MTMFGSGAGPNAITSFVGNEIINDSQEDDNISRGRKADIIFGEEDNDLLKGGGGTDELDEGSEADVVKGGRGKDVCVETG
jgi:Ca2+-binding RTX toxin-like protein